MSFRYMYLNLSMLFIFAPCSSRGPLAPIEQTGKFSLLTYNVAGLPQIISPGKPEENIPLMSPLLNQYDIALVQEDFYYHDELSAQAKHLEQSESNNGPGVFDFGDGLNRFSIFPFGTLSRQRWQSCSNESGMDCFAKKGVSFAQTEIQPGVYLHIYNVHLDAGGTEQDFAAREVQVLQLLDLLESESGDNAVIVAGDLNLNVERPPDIDFLDKLMREANLKDVCRTRECGTELVDRVLYRSSPNLQLEPLLWQIDEDFVNEFGAKLSDHFAIGVEFEWRALQAGITQSSDNQVWGLRHSVRE